MSSPASPLPLILRAALTACLLSLGSSLLAAEAGFTSALSADQKTAAGLGSLTDAERTALDQLVAREAELARQDDSSAGTGDFLSHCSPRERQQAGLDQLTPAELASLSQYVAAATVMTRPKPRERPRIKDSDLLNPADKPQVHGSISLTYGQSGHGSFHGGSLWVDYFDPKSGFGLSVGLATFSGHGFRGLYPGYYNDLPPYYGGLLDSYSSLPYDDFVYGDGQSFRASTAWDQAGRYRRGL